MKQRVFSAARLQSLSDGVFAIAMTLLVLDLKLPPLDAATDPGAFTTAAVAQFPRFVSWILSFAILCRLWITHHGLLSTGGSRSRAFITWNLVFLGAIAFIPFPTSLLSEHHDRALSVFIFSATYVVAGVALGRMAVAYTRQLGTAGAAGESTAVTKAVSIIFATALIACALALFRPWLGTLVWVAYPFVSMLTFRGRPPEKAPDDGNEEIVNDRIADRSLVMLGDYVNVDTKTLFQCSEGHTWEATPYHVMKRLGNIPHIRAGK